MKLKDRTLAIGDRCEYNSAYINGTGRTWGRCIVTEIIDQEKKIYRVTEDDDEPREWVVQDIDDKVELERIGKNAELLEWIE